MAIKLIGRQDMMLTFGDTNTLSATGDAPCGYDASYTDGTIIDLNGGSLEGMEVKFKVKTAPDGTGTVTGAFFIACSDDKSTWKKVAISDAIGSATLVAGYEYKLAIPHGLNGRYWKAGVTMAGTTITAGKFTAMVDPFAGV